MAYQICLVLAQKLLLPCQVLLVSTEEQQLPLGDYLTLLQTRQETLTTSLPGLSDGVTPSRAIRYFLAQLFTSLKQTFLHMLASWDAGHSHQLQLYKRINVFYRCFNNLYFMTFIIRFCVSRAQQ